MQDSGQQWLNWWTQTCWQQATPGWHHLPFFRLEEELRQHLALTQQASVVGLLGLPDALPGFPDERVLTLSRASAVQLIQMLTLACEICQCDSGAQALDDAQRIWCQRISRALRPGLWLPTDLNFSSNPQTSALALLSALFPVATWLRLRMNFDYQTVMALPEVKVAPPHSKLQALWDAVIWRSQQQEGECYVDNQRA